MSHDWQNEQQVYVYTVLSWSWYWHYIQEASKRGLHPFENGRSPEFRTYISSLTNTKKRFTLPPDCDGNDERGLSHRIYVYIFLFFLFFFFVLSLDSCSLCNSHPPRPLNKTRHTQPGHPEKKRKNGKNQDLVWLLIQRKIKHNRVVTNNTECKNEVISLENCFKKIREKCGCRFFCIRNAYSM